MPKIVLEDKFSTHQKITFLLYIGGPFLIVFIVLFKMSIDSNLNLKGYFMLMVLLLIYIVLIVIAFLKIGFVKMDSKLYKGTFFRGKLISKKEIDISKTPKMAILKFRKSQKLAWFSGAKPDLAVNFTTFEINFLNENHTQRKQILDLKNKENVEPVIVFLTSNFDLKNEVYSPNFKK